MDIAWGTLWDKSHNRLKVGWLITAAVVAIYIGTNSGRDYAPGVAAERGAGVADSPEWDSASLWRQTGATQFVRGIVGGNLAKTKASMMLAAPASVGYSGEAAFDTAEERKIVRTASMDVVAKNPSEVRERIQQIAEQAGGFVEKSETYGQDTSASASLVVRVPANKFDAVRAEIRRLGVRVQSENIQAKDVTKQYVDQSARLRNLRAQETQYLGILKSAKTVKDTLDVSEKLDEVRGEIEQQQAEFAALSKQVETVGLSISLGAEADAQVFGLNWRPLYQLKLSAREGLQSIGDYAASMASFLFYLPSILLWLATILIGAAIGWRVMRWAGRALFVPRRASA